MSNTYTFSTLTKSPIQYSSTGECVQISKVVIPRIQRAYAQGRTAEKETKIRTGFVNSIFEHLTGSSVMVLHFIYGAVKEKLIGGISEQQFELLDGQQRFTTLYLLHWYLLNRESDSMGTRVKGDIEDALISLVYETRTTTTEFCQSLARYRCDLDKAAPSVVIKKAKWYYHRYDKDSSIVGMLVMLDTIHEKYNECKQPELWKSLDKLQFYVLPLVKYQMSEDLYIKMNQRGLQLSLFDNFKAELIGVMKTVPTLNQKVTLTGGHKVSHHESISIQLDSKWIDLFWNPGRTDYDVHYMRFFSRFFAYRYMLDSNVQPEQMQNTELPINVFYTQSEDKKKRGEYLGFEKYAEVLKGQPNHYDYFEMIEKVLNTLHDSNNMDVISASLTPVWEANPHGNFFINADVPFSQSLLVVFGAICEFILAFDAFDCDTFKKWMRVVWNLVENTNIDSLTAATRLLLNIKHLMSEIARNMKSGKNFCEAAKDASPRYANSWPRAFKEEIEKARRITEDPQWLDEFIDAEKHPYLKGTVGFFYDKSLTLCQFIQNRNLVKTMFDKDGIAPEYRERHLLIRAIVSNLKTWDKGLKNRYITEKAEANKRLKNLLLDEDNDDIRKMFVDVLGSSTDTEQVKHKLATVIINNRMSYYSNPAQKWDNLLVVTQNALCDDIKLYDWMATQSSPVCVSEYKGHNAVAIPRVWYDRFLIDSERDKIALSLMTNLLMIYVAIKDHTSLQDYYTQERFKAENILLYRGVNNGISFHVDFLKDHISRVYLKCPDEQHCQDVKNKIDTYLEKNPTIKETVPNFNTLEIMEKKDDIYRIYLDVDTAGNYRDIFKYLFFKDFPISEIMKIYRIIAEVV